MLLFACWNGGIVYAWDDSWIIGFFYGLGAVLIIFLVWDHYKDDKAIISISISRVEIF